jgi:hypothetical protein
LVVGRKQVTHIGIRTKGKKVMSVHAVGVLLEKIYLFIYKYCRQQSKDERKNGRGKEVQTNCRL